jgi:hypothetical protein
MQTCKEWKAKDAELFKRTKELGYNRRDAKKLLAFWGDWWWREEADEDEDEDEEKEKEEEEDGEDEMEEEIEELGLPKSITSAGEESSSKPTDAVEYDGEKAEEEAEEEKMLPTIAVAAISSGEGKKGLTLPEEGPSPSDAVQRPSSTDAVEGSVPTDDEEKDGEQELSS